MFSRHVATQLSAFCENELFPEESERVAAHLEQCERCRLEYEEVRFGVFLAGHLGRVEAPATTWEAIDAAFEELAGAGSPAAASWYRGARAWPMSAAIGVLLSAALAAALWVYLGGARGRDEARPYPMVALDAYLTGVESAAPDDGAGAIGRGATGFEPVEVASALRMIGIGAAHEIGPLAGQRVLTSWRKRLGAYDVLQLVYGEQEATFSVFVAPPPVRFDFGGREVTDVRVGEVACRKVDCPRTSTLWFDAGELQWVLVTKSTDPVELAAIVGYFVEARSR